MVTLEDVERAEQVAGSWKRLLENSYYRFLENPDDKTYRGLKQDAATYRNKVAALKKMTAKRG